jgi:hypothetical protein
MSRILKHPSLLLLQLLKVPQVLQELVVVELKDQGILLFE